MFVKVTDKTISRLSSIRQAAVFDTAFHSRMANHVFRYPVPEEWYRQWGVRRYEQAHWLITVLSYTLGMGSMGPATTLWCRQWVGWWGELLQAPVW